MFCPAEFGQQLLDFGEFLAIIRLSILFLLPDADANRFGPVRVRQDDFLPETFLALQQWNDLLVENAVEFGQATAFQAHRNESSKRVILLWLTTYRMKVASQTYSGQRS